MLTRPSLPEPGGQTVVRINAVVWDCVVGIVLAYVDAPSSCTINSSLRTGRPLALVFGGRGNMNMWFYLAPCSITAQLQLF